MSSVVFKTWQHLIGFLAAQAKGYNNKSSFSLGFLLKQLPTLACLLETGLPSFLFFSQGWSLSIMYLHVKGLSPVPPLI
jgi:hypothetical protein